MSEDSSSDNDYERDTYDNGYYSFGIEPNQTYSGEKIEKLDDFYRTDEEMGHIFLDDDIILNHRYQINKIIGKGTFCFVWLAYDHLRLENVAIKVLKLDDDRFDSEQFQDEVVMNEYLSTVDPEGKSHITQFHEVFFHENHCCIVFELVAQNILTFINYFDDQFVLIPIPLIKKIVVDTLKGLHFMHKHGTIHTDLKPENVCASKTLFPYEPFCNDENYDVFNCLEDDPSTINFKLNDFGNSCFINGLMNDVIQTRQYRSPEVMLGLQYDTSADIWSLACMTYELSTRRHLFDPIIGKLTEDHKNKNKFDAMHLSMIEAVIGPIPKDWARNGKFYKDLYKGGKLIETSKPIPSIYDLLIHHGLAEKDARDLSEFLEPMLSIIPKQRPTALELLDSPWLFGV